MRVLRRLFHLWVPYRTTLAVSVVLLSVHAGVELLPPLFQPGADGAGGLYSQLYRRQLDWQESF